MPNKTFKKIIIISLDKNGHCFQYLCHKFSVLSEAKLKEGIVDGTQISYCQNIFGYLKRLRKLLSEYIDSSFCYQFTL